MGLVLFALFMAVLIGWCAGSLYTHVKAQHFETDEHEDNSV